MASRGAAPRKRAALSAEAVERARVYMREVAEPVVSQLVKELAVAQPADVIEFMAHFVQRELSARVARDEAEIAAAAEEEELRAAEDAELREMQEQEALLRELEAREATAGEEEVGAGAAEEEKGAEREAEARTTQKRTPAASPNGPASVSSSSSSSSSSSGKNRRASPSASSPSSSKSPSAARAARASPASPAAGSGPPVCCVSGTPAELQVRLPGSGEVKLYARDVFEALKRKNKMRGAVFCELGERLPALPDVAAAPFPLSAEEQARIAVTKTVEQIDSRPVTPPKRGFEMTRPGENYANGEGPRAVGPVAPVAFEPRALGSENAADRVAAAREAADRRAAEAEKADNLSDEQREELRVKRKKDQLVGTIQAHYANMGQAEPLGLAAASVETLQRHLDKLKARQEAGRAARLEASEREEKSQSVASAVAQKVAKVIAPGGAPQDTAAPARLGSAPQKLAFEPRALGGAAPGDQPAAADADDTPEKRRERAAMAAAKRFGTVK